MAFFGNTAEQVASVVAPDVPSPVSTPDPDRIDRVYTIPHGLSPDAAMAKLKARFLEANPALSTVEVEVSDVVDNGLDIRCRVRMKMSVIPPIVTWFRLEVSEAAVRYTVALVTPPPVLMGGKRAALKWMDRHFTDHIAAILAA